MAKGRDTKDNFDEKRRLLDSLEALRAAPDAAAVAAPRGEIGAGGFTRLAERLRSSEATVAILRDEVRQLERQALEAIGEVGRLRRQLDQRGLPPPDAEGMEALQARLAASEGEKALLTGALTESENEIARMTRTLDLVVRKFNLAV